MTFQYQDAVREMVQTNISQAAADPMSRFRGDVKLPMRDRRSELAKYVRRVANKTLRQLAQVLFIEAGFRKLLEPRRYRIGLGFKDFHRRRPQTPAACEPVADNGGQGLAADGLGDEKRPSLAGCFGGLLR